MDLYEQLHDTSKRLSPTRLVGPQSITIYLDNNGNVVDDCDQAAAARVLHFDSNCRWTGTTYVDLEQQGDPINRLSDKQLDEVWNSLQKLVENAETGSVPAEKGTVPIPEGHVRLYHYTKGDPQQINQQGLLLRHAKGSTYGEPNLIWGSTIPPEGHHTIVEFHVPSTDLTSDAERPPSSSNLADWQQGYHHTTIRRDILPHEIIAVHEPWHDRYRYIKSDPEALNEVVAGLHDDLLKDREYGPAIRLVKQEQSTINNERLPEAGIPSRDIQGGKWATVSNGPDYMDHVLVAAPADLEKGGKGRKPKVPISPPGKAEVDHLTLEEAKHQDILHHHQHKLLKKINSGKASHDDHSKFSKIRQRLNELHKHVRHRKELKELEEEFRQQKLGQEQANWQKARAAGDLSDEEIAERDLLDRYKEARAELDAKRAAELGEHFDANG